mmetsp:Transcript_44371/g.128378  ORF Transcript_44371/g.128378 Transcript_44371/m.128378 type:complete len:217 (+) Transcript_44371:1076-1726(+)
MAPGSPHIGAVLARLPTPLRPGLACCGERLCGRPPLEFGLEAARQSHSQRPLAAQCCDSQRCCGCVLGGGGLGGSVGVLAGGGRSWCGARRHWSQYRDRCMRKCTALGSRVAVVKECPCLPPPAEHCYLWICLGCLQPDRPLAAGIELSLESRGGWSETKCIGMQCCSSCMRGGRLLASCRGCCVWGGTGEFGSGHTGPEFPAERGRYGEGVGAVL